MPNDIDILIVGDADRDAVDLAAERVEQRLGFPTQAVVRTRHQWDEGAESFIRELKARPLYVVLVDKRNVGADLFGFAADPALDTARLPTTEMTQSGGTVRGCWGR